MNAGTPSPCFPHADQLIERLPMGVVVHGASGAIVAANAAAERLLGLTLDEMRGATSDDPRWGATREDGSPFPGAEHPAMVALRDGEPVGPTVMGVFHRVRRTRTWIRVTATPVFDGRSSRPTGAYALFEDITERRRDEQSLRLQQSILATLLEGVCLIEIDSGRIVYANAKFEAMYGYGGRELVGRHVSVLSAGDDATVRARLAAIGAVLRRDGTWEGEVAGRAKDGRRFWCQACVSTFAHDEYGMVWVLVQHDITERKRATAELEAHRSGLEALVGERTKELQAASEALARTQFAMDRVGIGIHWVDPSTGRYTYVNQAAAAMLGYTATEMLDLTVFETSPYLAVPEVVEQFAQPHGGFVRIEVAGRTKAGREVPLEASIYCLVGREGKPDQLIAFVTDISTRKRGEQQLQRAKAAAEAANVAKSAFLANMSHEIRTPLSAITGMAYLLRRSALDAQQQERLARIDTAAKHLLDIVNAVLDLSKIEAGKLELEDVDVDLAQMTADVLAMVAERARAKGIELAVDAMPQRTGLRADRTRLQQALLNYVENAVKFTDAGRITVHTRPVEETDDGVLVRFEVTDTGRGIRPEVLPRLFAAFEQADNSLTRQYGGTGLGLAITRRLAELMGGETGVDSTPGVGSTFWFTALLRKGRTAGAPARAEVPLADATLTRACRGRRILLAEDEAINREIIVELAHLAGLEVDIAHDGAEAVERGARARYDLVLMDMQMPRMDGLEATRQLRQLPGWSSVPIVALTANAFAADRTRCLDAGMSDFMAKPVEPERFFRMLLAHLAAPAP